LTVLTPPEIWIGSRAFLRFLENAMASRRHEHRRPRCWQVRLELGVYVLGVIGIADRIAIDAHLACCADCRDELEKLAYLPRLLSRLTADEAERLVR
jgi:Putative zinc-finger